MRLILDVFSGRPNPSFNLSLEVAKVVVDFIQDLPTVNSFVFPTVQRLGYRGFIIDFDDDNKVYLEFYKKTVRATYNDGKEAFFKDILGFEDFLKEVMLQCADLSQTAIDVMMD